MAESKLTKREIANVLSVGTSFLSHFLQEKRFQMYTVTYVMNQADNNGVGIYFRISNDKKESLYFIGLEKDNKTSFGFYTYSENLSKKDILSSKNNKKIWKKETVQFEYELTNEMMETIINEFISIFMENNI